MCGINGLLTTDSSFNIETAIHRMNDLIVHRGPDDDGVFVDPNVHLAMGMRRLSIIDLEGGAQPIYSNNGNLVIVFNGELYNYKELKKELVSLGVCFESTSDTEVVLKMYEHFGLDSLKRLNGMYGFSIYDKSKHKILVVRDRLGEKPIYYLQNQKYIIWASELKSIRDSGNIKKFQIDDDALSLFLSLGYIPAPYTIFKGIRKLEPGHFISINLEDASLEVCRYWDIENSNKDQLSYEEASLELRKLMYESVRMRMVADVPLGVFLSGGVDSAIVSTIMSDISDRPIKTFSIGFEEKKYDESNLAKKISEHIRSEHHELIITGEDLLSVADKVIANFDEPFADSSAIPAFFVSQLASENVKVALTGDGADEVFGGYNKYLVHTVGEKISKLIPKPIVSLAKILVNNMSYFSRGSSKSLRRKIFRMFNAYDTDWRKRHLKIMTLLFSEGDKSKILSSESHVPISVLLKEKVRKAELYSKDVLKSARYLDKEISLDGDMLVKVDRTSMLNSLECRAPFLDHRLIELTYDMPDAFLVNGSDRKWILKKTFSDLVPEGHFDAPKSGFEIPISQWLKGPLANDLISTLSEGNLKKHKLFNEVYINQMMEDHLSGHLDNGWKLWALYVFQKWYNQCFERHLF